MLLIETKTKQRTVNSGLVKVAVLYPAETFFGKNRLLRYAADFYQQELNYT